MAYNELFGNPTHVRAFDKTISEQVVQLRNLIFATLIACNRPAVVDPPSQPTPVADVVELTEAAVVTDADVTDVAPPQKVMRAVSRQILIVGDSEACAVRPLAQKVFDEQDKSVGIPADKVSVECKGGTTVPYWGAQGHLKEALVKHPNPDVVVVFLGTNHYGQDKAPDVSVVLDGIENSGAQCVWVGNTAVDGRHWKINKLIRDAVTPRCRYFDTEAANIPLADNAHPTGPGAVKWLRLVWGMIPAKFEEDYE